MDRSLVDKAMVSDGDADADLVELDVVEEPRHDASREPDLLFHRVFLILAVAVIAAACVLRVEGHERVVVPVINQALPGVCTYKRMFGISCPGCGLTRCFISLGHGDVTAAWGYNPAGVLFFLIVAAQIPYRMIQIGRVRRGLPELRAGWISQALFWAIFASLMLQWLLRTFIAT